MSAHRIDLAQATDLARAALAGVDAGHDLVLLDERTTAHPFGWVFAYTTRRHRDTGDIRYAVPGTGPLVVDGDDGQVSFLPTSVPPPAAIAEYERRWRARRPAP